MAWARRWAKPGDYDRVYAALERIREKSRKDLQLGVGRPWVVDELIAEVKETPTKGLEETTAHPDEDMMEVYEGIDWERMEGLEQMNEDLRRRIEELAPQLKELQQTGKISNEEVAGLLNIMPIERLTSKQKEQFRTRITELEEEVEKLRKPAAPPPTPEEAARAARREAAKGPLSPEEVELLYNTFSSVLTRRTKRGPFETEIMKFEGLVSTLQKVRPPLKFVQARIQVENLARQVSSVATSGRIVLRRGQARVDQLLEKMLSRGLSPEEEDELRRLREGEEFTSTEVIEYPPPTIFIVADSGPWRVNYPTKLGGYWDRASAEQNAANWTSKGFEVRIEEDHEHQGEG